MHRGDRRRARRLACVNAAALAVIAVYLWNNYRLTGYATGQRTAAAEPSGSLLADLTAAQLAELNFIAAHFQADIGGLVLLGVGLLIPAFVVAYHLRTGAAGDDASRSLSPAPTAVLKRARRRFLVMGATYWVTIVSLRFSADFDPFSYRLLIPSSLFFVLALLTALRLDRPRLYRCAARALLALAAISVAYNAVYRPAQMLRANPRTFPAALADVAAAYRHVPAGSLVLCGNEHLQYLRIDLVVVPASRCSDQPLSEWVARHRSTRSQPVYAVDGEIPLWIPTDPPRGAITK
jgi:hypothetical protein